jgi:hypothetical protein
MRLVIAPVRDGSLLLTFLRLALNWSECKKASYHSAHDLFSRIVLGLTLSS